jgi:hypothetical protein
MTVSPGPTELHTLEGLQGVEALHGDVAVADAET